MAPSAPSSLNRAATSHTVPVPWGDSDIAISLLFRQTGTFTAPLFMLP